MVGIGAGPVHPVVGGVRHDVDRQILRMCRVGRIHGGIERDITVRGCERGVLHQRHGAAICLRALCSDHGGQGRRASAADIDRRQGLACTHVAVECHRSATATDGDRRRRQIGLAHIAEHGIDRGLGG